MPEGVAPGIVKGMYRLSALAVDAARGHVRLLGSGAILREVIAAAQMLADDWHVASEVFSVTSFAELARGARGIERDNRLHPGRERGRSHLEECLPGDAPIVAATDYVRAYPQLIAAYVRAPMTVLETDGFGRSDRRAELRTFFEVSRCDITVVALDALARHGAIDRSVVGEALARYGVDPQSAPSWSC